MGRLFQAEQLDSLTASAPEFKPTGWSALHMLAFRPDRPGQRGELARLLLDKDADPNLVTNTVRLATPLHTAAGTCNFEVAKVLLSRGDIKVNPKNKDNKHPWDCAKSNKKMQELLWDNGGRESQDKTGKSSRDEPNSRSGTSKSRFARAANWRAGQNRR